MPITPIENISTGISQANSVHTTSRPAASIASLQGFLGSSLSKIISSSMDDHGALQKDQFFCLFVFGYSTYSNNALRSNQLDELIRDRGLAIALGISLEVAKIAHMAGLVGWSTVCLSEWIDC